MALLYEEKFKNIDKNIFDIKEMVKTMIEKDEDRISRLIEMEVRLSKAETDIKNLQTDTDKFFEKLRSHCNDHNGMGARALMTVLKWIGAISGAVIGLGVITAGLIWLFKTLKLV